MNRNAEEGVRVKGDWEYYGSPQQKMHWRPGNPIGVFGSRSGPGGFDFERR